MINLLPYETEKQLKAARFNSMLIKYLLVIIAAVAFLALISGLSYILIGYSKPTNISSQASTSSASGSPTEELAQIKSNINIAKSIYNKDVSYSDILSTISENLPTGSIIGSLNVSTNDANSQVELTIYAKSSDASTKATDNLQKVTKFSNFTIKTSQNSQSTVSGYPITVSATAQVAKS